MSDLLYGVLGMVIGVALIPFIILLVMEGPKGFQGKRNSVGG